MSIPPIVVSAARRSWNWQWKQLMNGLGPTDSEGNYKRPVNQHINEIKLDAEDLSNRTPNERPRLIIGRSCPWAHRTWLVYQIRNLGKSLSLVIASADHAQGQWKLDPPWMGCNSLLSLYKYCGTEPSHRATVPTLIDPSPRSQNRPTIISNESAQIVEALSNWPVEKQFSRLYPDNHKEEIAKWQKLLQPSVNDGVYRCGFAPNQSAYNKASTELIEALSHTEKSLQRKGPWLCGKTLTIADIRLFPTLIRWEMVYQPLFGCSEKPLWAFPKLWKWRKRLFNLPHVSTTCDSEAWRNDYFGALFPLTPSNIVPAGPELVKIVNTSITG